MEKPSFNRLIDPITALGSVAFLTALATLPALAADRTWVGGYGNSGTWNQASQWLEGAYANGSDVIFNNVTGASSTSTFLSAGRTVKSITFNGGTPSPAFNIRLATSGSGGTGANLTFISTNTGITVAAANTASHNIGQSDGSIVLAADLLVTHNGTGTLTLSRPVTGVGFNLTKAGSGLLVLSAANTHSGDTIVDGGTLRATVGGSSANSEVIINNIAATFSVNVNDNTKSWTCNAFTPAAAATLEFNFGATAPSTTDAPLVVTNAADFSTATPAVSVLVNAGLLPGTYPLMTWGSTSGTAPSTPDLTVFPIADGTAPSLQVAGNTLNLVITSTAPTIVKANNSIALFDGPSWVGNTAPGAGDLAVWNSTVNSPNTTVLGNNLLWAGISIENPNGPVTINAGHTLTLGAAAVDIDMSTAHAADLTLNCPLTLDATNTWNVAASRTLTLGGQVSGAFSVTKLGDGTAILSSGANNYSGDTTVSAGVLKLGASDVIPNGAATGNVAVAGTLDLNGKNESVNGLSGAGIIDNMLAATSPALTVGSNDQTGTFSGVLQNTAGTLNLIKTGTGTLTLGGVNTFSGTVTISPGTGTLALDKTNPLNNVSGITIGADATLRSGFTGTVLQAPITLGGSATNANITAPLFPSNNTGATTPKTLDLQGKITGAGDLTLLGVNGYNQYGTIILSAQSDYTGTTLITTASGYAGAPVDNAHIFVRLDTEDALPVTTVVTLDGGIAEPLSSGRNCELNLNGNDQTLAGLTNVTRPALRIQRVCNRNTTIPSVLTINNATDFTYSGFLGSSTTANFSNFGVTKGGAGKQTFSGTIGYSGDTTVTQGILSLGVLNEGTVNNNLSTVTIATSAKLDLTFAGSDTVDKLVIGNTQKVAGIYGALLSGAQFEIPQITGTGTLTVSSSPPVGGFSSWITGPFTNGTIPEGQRGPNDDFDNDGIRNLVEYAIAGQDPTVPNAFISTFSALGTLSFSKRLDATGLTYAIQQSTDLGNLDDWTPVTGTPPNYVNDATTISYKLTPGTPAKNFLRLQVVTN